MKLKQLKEVLNAKVLYGDKFLDKDVKMACGSDLMSDVLAFIKADAVLLTGLTNPQVVRTAEMAEVIAICFVRGKKPQEKTLKLAQEKEIPVLVSEFSMYACCGRLYKEGLLSCDGLK